MLSFSLSLLNKVDDGGMMHWPMIMMMMTTAFTNQQDSQMSCTESNVTHLMQIFPPNLKLEAPTESTITGMILLHLLNSENKK